MKKFIKKILIIIAIFTATAATTNLTPTPVYAEDGDNSNCRYLLGMPSWDCHTIPEPSEQSDLENNIWIIASNIFTDITIAASYLVLGFVIYGGYLYILSNGDPGKVAAGKRTLTNAFIGLGITLLASVILNAIRIAFIKDKAMNCNVLNGTNCLSIDDSGTVITNLITWVLGITGVVAVIFVIIGGIGYVTSAGDPGKVQKSRKTLIYALIGLAIVGLSSVITAFVTNAIKNSAKTSYINETTIAKEVLDHEK